MANRIPLIVDTLNDNKIKELPIGDNLDLGGAGITNAGTINATDVRINNVSFNNPFSGDYNDLTNKPVIPTVPTVLSAFTNDLGYLASGTTTDQINEGTTNLYFTNARFDTRIQNTTLSTLSNVDTVSSADDGKVLYYDHSTQRFKLTAVVTESDTIDSVLGRGNTTTRDFVTTGKVYFANWWQNLVDLPSASTYHGMVAHVHGTGKLYFAHAGQWEALVSEGNAFTGFSTAADDATARTIHAGDTVTFTGGTGISTTSDANGNITFTLGALGDLQNVDTTGVNNGEALIYNNALSRWEPGTVSSSVSEIGDLTDVNVVTVAPQDNYVLSWSGANNEWRPRVLNNLDAATVSTQTNADAFSQYLTFVQNASGGGQTLRTDTGIIYNPSTNTLTTNSINVNTAIQIDGTMTITGSISNAGGDVEVADNLALRTAGELKLYDGENNNFNAFRSPATMTSNYTYILPAADGNANEVLTTDGSGSLSWSAGGAQNLFANIAVSGQNTVTADSPTDTLTLVAGSNITISTDNNTDTITISASGGGGGAGNPGGSDTQVQYNDGGSFGGESTFTYNETSNTLSVTNITATTISADDITASGTGIPTLTSASNLILDAANAVVLQKSVLRLGIYDTDGVNSLTGQIGDVIYNSSVGSLQFFDGSNFVSPGGGYSFNIGGDDSTMRNISSGESIKIIGGSNVSTSSDVEGNITISASLSGAVTVTGPSEGDMTYYNGSVWVATASPVIRYVLGANGSSDFTFTGPGLNGAVNDPTITVHRGFKYIFSNNSGGSHPFQIQSTSGQGGTAYSSGVTNNGANSGDIVWEVRHDAPSTLYYQCTAHSNMGGTFNVADVSSGGISISSPSAGDMIYYNGTAWTATQGPVYYYTVTSNGSSAYRFTGPGVDATTDNPNFTLYKGATYIFNNTTGSGHPFAIRTGSGGSSFTQGVSGSTTGTQIFTVPHEPSDTSLVYQCTIHGGMVGNLTIV